MLRNAVFLFIIFFSSFCFSQPKSAPQIEVKTADTEKLFRPPRPKTRTADATPAKEEQAKLREAFKRRREKYETLKAKRGKGGTRSTPDPKSSYSFSGSDCKVYSVKRQEITPLKSVMTVSLSVYEAKAPVRRLGHAAPVGFTGNIRSIAGSIICLMQNEHPLKGLMIETSKHFDDKFTMKQFHENGIDNEGTAFQAGMIEPFDLMLLYKNEVNSSVGLQINNIDIISESVVTSINDIYTEMVFQFVATDVNQIAKKAQQNND